MAGLLFPLSEQASQNRQRIPGGVILCALLLALAQALDDDASLAATLGDEDYRVTGLRYELLDKARHQAPRRAFRRTRVTMELQPASATSSPQSEIVLSAEIDLDHRYPQPVLEQLEISRR